MRKRRITPTSADRLLPKVVRTTEVHHCVLLFYSLWDQDKVWTREALPVCLLWHTLSKLDCNVLRCIAGWPDAETVGITGTLLGGLVQDCQHFLTNLHDSGRKTHEDHNRLHQNSNVRRYGRSTTKQAHKPTTNKSHTGFKICCRMHD